MVVVSVTGYTLLRTAGVFRARVPVTTALVVLAVAAIAIVAAGHRHHGAAPAPPAHRPGALVRPSQVFSQAPYMGVACPVANSIVCDRVGLAVWLRRPARAVTASIGGRPFALNWHGDSPPGSAPQRARRAFDGYLQPAGIVARLRVTPESGGTSWYGDGAPSPLVTFRIEYGDGRVVVTRERVQLAAGWG